MGWVLLTKQYMERQLTITLSDATTLFTEQLADIERAIHDGKTKGRGWKITRKN